MIVLADLNDACAGRVAALLDAPVRRMSVDALPSLQRGTLVVHLATRNAAEIAGALEVLDLPFTGAGAAGLLCSANEDAARAIVSGAGVRVAESNGSGVVSVPVIGNAPDALTRTITRELRLDGYCRVDYRVTKSGERLFLRADARPRLDALAALAGVSFESLVARIIAHTRQWRRSPRPSGSRPGRAPSSR